MDIESELLQVPEVEPEIFINISTKSISTMISQLEIFGDIVELDFNKNELSFKGSGDNGDIKILLKDDKHENLNNCEINLDGNLKLSYSVKYIQNFCSFSKINKNVNLIFKLFLGLESDFLFFFSVFFFEIYNRFSKYSEYPPACI